LSDLRVKIRKYLGVSVSETGRVACKAAFCDEIGQQPDSSQSPRTVLAKAGNDSRDSYWFANDEIVERLPTAHCQERVMSCHFDGPSAPRGHFKTRVHATIDPLADLVGADRAI